MKLKELKEIIESYPDEYDEMEVVFGECGYGEKVKKIVRSGQKILICFV